MVGNEHPTFGKVFSASRPASMALAAKRRESSVSTISTHAFTNPIADAMGRLSSATVSARHQSPVHTRAPLVIQLGVLDVCLHQLGRKHGQLSVLKFDIAEDIAHVYHGMCRSEQVSVAVSASIVSSGHEWVWPGRCCLTAVRNSDFFAVAFVRVSYTVLRISCSGLCTNTSRHSDSIAAHTRPAFGRVRAVEIAGVDPRKFRNFGSDQGAGSDGRNDRGPRLNLEL